MITAQQAMVLSEEAEKKAQEELLTRIRQDPILSVVFKNVWDAIQQAIIEGEYSAKVKFATAKNLGIASGILFSLGYRTDVYGHEPTTLTIDWSEHRNEE